MYPNVVQGIATNILAEQKSTTLPETMSNGVLHNDARMVVSGGSV